ncbi:MAG: glycosyltransferase [Candidatus Acidiferrales bacterium]
MHLAILSLFCCCAGLIAWVYFGYPLALSCGLFGRTKESRPADGTGPQADSSAASCPDISVIIPAHNEEAAIADTIRNILNCNYPRDRMEIFVGSDGSSDRTQEIVERFRNDAVSLVSFPQHRGKSAIQNALVKFANGSILVFTDADCLWAPDSLRCLVQHFSDARVGLVTGAPGYSNMADTGTAANEGLYLRYETWLRKAESDRGLLAMASGSLFAVRSALWKPLAPNHGDDFVLPLSILRNGMRNVLELRARPITSLAQTSLRALLRLKIRIVSKDFCALLENRDLLNPFRYGSTAIALCSHKLLRWSVPYLALVMFVSVLFLLDRSIFRVAITLLLGFCAAAVVGIVFQDKVRARVFSVPASFAVVNIAAAIGILKGITGHVSGLWEPDRIATKSAERTTGFQRTEP